MNKYYFFQIFFLLEEEEVRVGGRIRGKARDLFMLFFLRRKWADFLIFVCFYLVSTRGGH